MKLSDRIIESSQEGNFDDIDGQRAGPKKTNKGTKMKMSKAKAKAGSIQESKTAVDSSALEESFHNLTLHARRLLLRGSTYKEAKKVCKMLRRSIKNHGHLIDEVVLKEGEEALESLGSVVVKMRTYSRGKTKSTLRILWAWRWREAQQNGQTSSCTWPHVSKLKDEQRLGANLRPAQMVAIMVMRIAASPSSIEEASNG